MEFAFSPLATPSWQPGDTEVFVYITQRSGFQGKEQGEREQNVSRGTKAEIQWETIFGMIILPLRISAPKLCSTFSPPKLHFNSVIKSCQFSLPLLSQPSSEIHAYCLSSCPCYARIFWLQVADNSSNWLKQ